MVPISLTGKENKSLAEKWLPKIATGESTACVALNEFIGKREDNGLTIKDNKISGISIFAIDGEVNPDFIITAVDNDLYLVEIENDNVEISPLPTIDSTRVMTELVFHSRQAQKISGGFN